MTEKESQYPLEISKVRLAEIRNEIDGDVRLYLKNCSENYLEYVMAAQALFPDLYKRIENFDAKFDLLEYLSKVDEAKKAKDSETDIGLLKEGLDKTIYTPATYDRLALKYERNGNLEKARDACLRWFETDYWKLPNMSKGSLRILKRLERLEKKYGAQQWL